MLSEEIKRQAKAQAQKMNISFADFVRQAIADKLPQRGEGTLRLKQRRRDPVFRLLDEPSMLVKDSPTDTALRHDDYLYGAES
jgi:hypothetical protein